MMTAMAVPGIAADRDAVLNYYFNNGYQNATFDWTQSAGPLPTQVDLHFVVRPGKQEFGSAAVARVKQARF